MLGMFFPPELHPSILCMPYRHRCSCLFRSALCGFVVHMFLSALMQVTGVDTRQPTWLYLDAHTSLVCAQSLYVPQTNYRGD